MKGTLTSGEGKAADFIAADKKHLADAIGFSPYPGTLNLTGRTDFDSWDQFTIPHNDDFCEGITIIPCRIAGVRSAVIRPHVPDYPTRKMEILAPIHLRKLLDIDDGDILTLRRSNDVWPPASQTVKHASLDAFDAVVFDLDETLIKLNVDWRAVQGEIERQFGVYFDHDVSTYSMNEVYNIARAEGIYEELLELLSTAEAEGIADSTAYPLSKCVRTLDNSIAVCTANSVDIAWEVLEKFNIAAAVDVVVGRESLDKQKPDPKPLNRCLEVMDVVPGDAAFVGDSQYDAQAATAAETSYFHPDQFQTN